MSELMSKINMNNDYNYFTVNDLHIVVERSENNEFEISTAPLWKLEDLRTVEFFHANDELTFKDKLESFLKKKFS